MVCITADSFAPAPLKEGSAIGAPRLPISFDLCFGDNVEQGAGQHIDIERIGPGRSEEHTSELQSLMRISYAVFCLKKKKDTNQHDYTDKSRHKQDKNKLI